MLFIAITNLKRNTVSILCLLAIIFCQKDESYAYSTVNQMDLNEQGQEEFFKKRVQLGFSKHGKVRLQQSIDDTRQL